MSVRRSPLVLTLGTLVVVFTAINFLVFIGHLSARPACHADRIESPTQMDVEVIRIDREVSVGDEVDVERELRRAERELRRAAAELERADAELAKLDTDKLRRGLEKARRVLCSEELARLREQMQAARAENEDGRRALDVVHVEPGMLHLQLAPLASSIN